MSNHKNAICILVINPNYIICDFLNKIISHDLYLIIDNNKNNFIEFKKKYCNINFIQINDNDCISKGFINSYTYQYGYTTNNLKIN